MKWLTQESKLATVNLGSAPDATLILAITFMMLSQHLTVES